MSQPLTEMISRCVGLINLTTFKCQVKSGGLNLLEPSGPVRVCNGLDLPH